MDKLISEITDYIDYLKDECNLAVSVHFEKSIIYSFNEKIFKKILPYNTHNNPYCIMIKSIEKEYRKCISCQKRIIEKCQKQEEFCGVCHACVCEYIHSIKSKEKVMGFVSVSGYRSENFTKLEFLSDAWRKYLSDEKVNEKICSVVISPLCRLFELFFDKYFSVSSPDGDEFNVMLQFVNEHHNRIELSDLCNYFHRSKSYISHIFKQKTSVTLGTYCNRLKIQDAKKLLTLTDFPITEIAFTTGFSDVSYFIYIFKKIVGSTPLKWRKLNK